MPMTDETTTEAVRAFLERRQRDPDWNAELDALGASALAVARMLDTADNPSACANAARELRMTLQVLRRDPGVPDGPSLVDELVQRRRERLEGSGDGSP